MRTALFISICVLISSCAQLTRLDTGRTVGKNNLELGGYIAAYGTDDPSTAGGELGSIALPVLGFQSNYGLTNKMDINFSLNTSGNIYINPKFQIVGDQESSFAVSILPGADMQISPPESNQTVFFRPHISGILSFHQNEWAAFMEPKYIYQNPDGSKTHFVGATIGLEYFRNQNTKLSLGYSYFPFISTDGNTGENLFNIGFGFKRIIVL